MNTDYTKLNALQISRECLQLISETLEPEQAGQILIDLYLYFYEGVEHQEYDTKVMNGIWKTVVTFTQAKADAFMRQHKNFFEDNPRKKKSDLSQDNAKVEQVTTEPIKVSQNEEKGPQNEELTTGYLPTVKPSQINKDLLKEIVAFTTDEHGRVKDTEEINNGWITNHERLIKKYGITNDYLCRCIYAVSQK